jgi:hypothetical protein
MNPYDATLPHVIARVAAWVRGLARRYRRQLVVAASLGLVIALGISSTLSPASSPAAASTQH